MPDTGDASLRASWQSACRTACTIPAESASRPGQTRRHCARAQQRVREEAMREHARWWERVGLQHSPCLSDESTVRAPPWQTAGAHICGATATAAASASQCTAQQCSTLAVRAVCALTCCGRALLRCVAHAAVRRCGRGGARSAASLADHKAEHTTRSNSYQMSHTAILNRMVLLLCVSDLCL